MTNLTSTCSCPAVTIWASNCVRASCKLRRFLGNILPRHGRVERLNLIFRFAQPSIFVRVSHAHVCFDSERLCLSNASTDCRFTSGCLAHDWRHATGIPSGDDAEVL